MDTPLTRSAGSRHPLFYYPLLSNPFLQLTSPCNPELQASSALTPYQPTSTTSLVKQISSTSPPQTSNFSINKILEIPASHSLTSETNTMQQRRNSLPVGNSLPLNLTNPHRNILDTAKMLWLHQMAYSQSQNSLLKATCPLEQKRVAKRRKLGRNPRIPFTQQQIDSLEKKYSASRYLSSLDVVGLSKELDLSEARVKIWFQNRRARERRDKRIGNSFNDDLIHSADTLPSMVSPSSIWPSGSSSSDPIVSLHIPGHMTSLHLNSMQQRQHDDSHESQINVDDNNNSGSSSSSCSDQERMVKQEMTDSDIDDY